MKSLYGRDQYDLMIYTIYLESLTEKNTWDLLAIKYGYKNGKSLKQIVNKWMKKEKQHILSIGEYHQT